MHFGRWVEWAISGHAYWVTAPQLFFRPYVRPKLILGLKTQHRRQNKNKQKKKKKRFCCIIHHTPHIIKKKKKSSLGLSDYLPSVSEVIDRKFARSEFVAISMLFKYEFFCYIVHTSWCDFGSPLPSPSLPPPQTNNNNNCTWSWCSLLVERRTRDRKAAGSNPGRRGGSFFFLWEINFCADSFIQCLSHPALPQWHVKDPGHSVNKYRWQIKPRHVYTLAPTKSKWADYAIQA